MFKSSMIEKEKDLKCANKHKMPILMVVLDPKLELNQRLLCSDCIKNFTTQFSTMGYELVSKQIKQNQKQKVQTIEKTIQLNIKQVEELLGNINKLKSAIAFQLDEIIGFSGGWIKNLLSVGHEYSQYSFHKELENLISKQLENSIDKSLLVDEINKVNSFWNVKINEKLEQFSSFKVYQKCQEILQNLSQTIQVKQEEVQQQKVSQQNNLQCQVDQIHEFKSATNQLASEPQINLQLIDDTIKQKSKCYAIAFNKTGTQMVSMSHFDIKVWNIIDGKLNYQSTLQGHSNYIYCLVYSKKQESFISSSNDKTIICWKQIKKNEWKASQHYREHKGWIGTMILNSQENQLFSAGEDQKIIVWKVDFSQNELTYLYQLEKHTKCVRSISLNECNTILVSSGDDQQIIVWEFGQGDKFYFKQVFTSVLNCSGCHIKFIKNNKFIWMPYSNELNCICVFDYEDGIFNEDADNRIQLLNSNKNIGCALFPIVYLKDKNMIFIRSKNIIYVIKEINGKLVIQNELDCSTKWSFGTTTDDGKYLIFWDEHKGGYSTYELQYK
ncbi:unnamed protein product (macronuclear) [Paramecium tetraurelia]|uniref:Uncharacterized protein n=1 Tax=Paramecium tetraurelia TaxID=5888 RepID=A0DAZ3_PARTE|nr:uncharacterized protein GSPATT00015117001 [Paramecium tetraurelia]CAK80210.1 unnamed protein product [Paramecium tetraurelia]|eukprot:XP_001447607.1 hypothetical protein (macronuclear) [Paramecium tetraurelia strain d4-2]